jgi:hypothetical protein
MKVLQNTSQSRMENAVWHERKGMLEQRKSAPVFLQPPEVRTALSFDYLLDFWEEEELEDNHGLGDMAAELNRRVADCPELQGEITDLSVLVRHEKLLGSLLSAVLPVGLTNLAFAAIAPPVSWDFLHMTPRFARELADENGQMRGCLLIDGLDWDYLRTLLSYLLIMRTQYGVVLPFQRSVLLGTVHSETGLLHTYQIRAQFDMLRVRPIGDLPDVDLDAVRSLGADMTSLEAWRELVPADQFEMYGFVVYQATDVSEENNRSRLKEILVLPDPLVDSEAFASITDLLRSLLGQPQMKFSVIGIEGDSAVCMDGAQGMRHNPDEALDSFVCERDRSELFQGEQVLHRDLQDADICSAYLRQLRDEGARSFLMLPLRNGRELIGALILTTDQPGELTSLTKLNLEGVTELFALALERTLSDAHAKIQSVMKEKFTAIHPSVEWKFRAAAMHYLRHHEIDDVVFPEAHSLYSSSDIRSSSTIRNAAIRKDLIQQILTARSVLERAAERSNIDYLGSLIFRLDRMISELEKGVRSGDESRIARLLATEIEPVFNSLERFGPGVHDSIEGYRHAVCTESGDLFQERRAYDESVDILTHRMTELLTERQAMAQKTFPHLFEMYRTDGVEHTIYVGNSLTERDDFSKLYLNELRLWQLKTVCMMARLSVELESETPQPLHVAHLILAQSDPVGLRYSQEEKTFNVDGAYNTSYEIIKKRIDKAHIKGTDERLTQPEKIAVVYTQNTEAEEYRLFFDYLQQQGFLQPGIESVDLEDLQGVFGLKALRVAVEV